MSNNKTGDSMGDALNRSYSETNTSALQLSQTVVTLTRQYQQLGQVNARVFTQSDRSLFAMQKHYQSLSLSVSRLTVQQRQYSSVMQQQSQQLQRAAQQEREFGKQLVNTAKAAYKRAALFKDSIMRSAQYQDTILDVVINNQLTEEQGVQLGSIVRNSAKLTNQDPNVLAGQVGKLLAQGLPFQQVEQYSTLLGQVTTGLRVSADQSSALFSSLLSMGAKDSDTMRNALDQLVWAGQQGGLGAPAMISAFGQLADDIKAHGMGLDSLGTISAMLQIGNTTMGGDNAIAGMKSWLNTMHSPEINQAYAKQGVDYKASMLLATKDGYSEFEASLKIAAIHLEETISQSGLAELQNSMGDPANLQTVMEKFKLAEIFTDPDHIKMVMGYRQNKDQFNAIQEGGQAGGQADNALGNVFADREQSPMQKFAAFGGALANLSMTVGNALLPPVLAIVEALTPAINSFNEWLTANPMLITGIAAVAAAMTGLRMVSLSISWVFSLFGKKVNPLGLLLRGLGQAVLFIGRVFAVVGRLLLLNPIGLAITAIAASAWLIYEYWQPIKEFFIGLWAGIKSVFEPVVDFFIGLWDGVTSAFESVADFFIGLWDGVTSAFESVADFFVGLWDGITSGFQSVVDFFVDGWDSITTLFSSATAVFTDIWDSITSIFSPSEGIGEALVNGIIQGVLNIWDTLKETVLNLGGAVIGWFKDKLGINSPSLVFANLGEGIAEGAAVGMERETPAVKEAALGIVAATTIALSAPAMATEGVNLLNQSAQTAIHSPLAPNSANGANSSANNAAQMVIHFAPQITVNGAVDAQHQLQDAVKMSFTEFQQLMKQYQHHHKRGAYQEINP